MSAVEERELVLLGHDDPERPQVWHLWPNGWPAVPGDKALCGHQSRGQAKRYPYEMCVVCEAMA